MMAALCKKWNIRIPYKFVRGMQGGGEREKGSLLRNGGRRVLVREIFGGRTVVIDHCEKGLRLRTESGTSWQRTAGAPVE